MHVQSILVGVDFDGSTRSLTEGSLAAARQALWLAERLGARVEFLHSCRWNPEDGLRTTTRAIDPSELEQLVQECGGEKPELIVSEEEAWLALTRRVLSGQNDMVVVAKRNRRRREDRRLGSTSMKLIRKCPSPVWVVRPDHEQVHRSILAATDLTAVGDRATEYAAFLAQAGGSALFAVHAWQMPLDLQMSASRLGDEEFGRRKEEIVQQARDHIQAIAGISELGQDVTVIITRDAPSHAILGVVQREDPDLVVLGTISRGGLAGVLVGSTAEKLIYELDCSLLVVKPDDFVCPLQSV